MSRQRTLRSVLTLLALAFAGLTAVAAQEGTSPTSTPNDYSDPTTWLCRPGREDACTVDISSTVVAADGTTSREGFAANPAAPIDCFYVYPTVSLDETPTSDMNAGPEEKSVVRSQLARFGSQCRLFAPLYRQFTLTALRARLSGSGGSGASFDRNVGYNDVVDAWSYYLEHDNQGRGVVLIGHSQGSGVLTRFIREHIDGQPIQDRIVSALLLGTTVAVPRGEDVGGTFAHMPLCRSAQQTGCVVVFATFRSTVPPPAASLFGRVRGGGEGTVAACTNPAALAGGSAELHPYLSTASREGRFEWTAKDPDIDTPFVRVPGLLTGECVERDGASYFEVTVHGDPADARADDIPGDVITNGEVNPGWGLHLIDANVAMGDLVALVGEQAKAYVAAHSE